MKKIIVIILFSILTTMTFSQNYYPLIEENRTWNVISVIITGPYPGDTSFSTLTYKFIGDTIIDSTTYLKLYRSSEENPINWTLDCFMRENEKKVWLKDISQDNEILMYDFSLNVGDSILDYSGLTYLIIDSTGFETIGQDERIKYYLSSIEMPDYYHETWIDGIGSSKGICFGGSVLFVGGWTWYLCMSENGELIFMNPNYESCYLITEVSENNEPMIQVYPNPTKSLIILENIDNIEIESITLTNLKGQLIKQFNSKKTKLDISEISPGLYFLGIEYQNGFLTKKLLIE